MTRVKASPMYTSEEIKEVLPDILAPYADKFPIGSTFNIGSVMFHLVGYALDVRPDGSGELRACLSLSAINPEVDAVVAMTSKTLIPADIFIPSPNHFTLDPRYCPSCGEMHTEEDHGSHGEHPTCQ